LLLYGSPGSGKPAIAASVVFNLDERRASNFDFKHNNASLSDPSVVWRTVASDLARFHPGVKSSLIEVLKGVDLGRDLALQFQRLVVVPLMKNQEELISNPPVVVLDALDECPFSNGRAKAACILVLHPTSLGSSAFLPSF
jgi:hypothetical protein